MLASELIEQLQDILETHGDIDVMHDMNGNQTYITVEDIEVEHMSEIVTVRRPDGTPLHSEMWEIAYGDTTGTTPAALIYY